MLALRRVWHITIILSIVHMIAEVVQLRLIEARWQIRTANDLDPFCRRTERWHDHVSFCGFGKHFLQFGKAALEILESLVRFGKQIDDVEVFCVVEDRL